jgi:hypothetical protein
VVIEGLGGMVAIAKREGTIKGIKLGKSLSLSHSLFVYDIILIGIVYVREVERYKKVIDLYRKATWMKVNVYKSSILFNGLEEGLERQCYQFFTFTSLIFENGLNIYRII